MEERKHIDRLYQEKFKDFEATPREVVWKNISSRLQEKERSRRVLPIWYRIAGVAAVLAIIFNFATNLFKTPAGITSETVSTQQDENFGEFSLASNTYNENMFRSSIILQAIMQDTRKNQEREEQKKSQAVSPLQETTAFANIFRNPEVIGISGEGYSFSQFNSLATTNYGEPASQIETGLESSPEREPESALKDLIALANDKNSLNENLVEKTSPSKRIRVSTTAAPIYFDNLGSGNAIDSRFANNESSGELSMAYGINVAYQLSEKVKIRSGISKLDLSYNTKNIAFTAAVNPTSLSGIDYKGDIPKFRIENSAARPFSNVSASAEFNRSSLASPVTGYLNQRLGFIEVPVEIEYVLVNKKIGINLIGGGSTLFLDDNVISLNSSNFSTNIGEANNLNSVSFTTNIGVGFDYKISPKFQVNLEPIFKYQLNTFDTTADLNPYYFGIYSGFSFKF